MSRHLMAKFRQVTAVHLEDPPDRPHSEWKELPNYNNAETRTDLTPEQKAQVYYRWHPPYGESHVGYYIYPTNDPREKERPWNAVHDGLYKGMTTVTDHKGNTWHINDYDIEDFADIGDGFATPEEAKSAVEKFHAQTYGHEYKPNADYYDNILNNLPELNEKFDIFGDDK